MARSISNVVRVAVWLFAASIAAGAPNSPQFVDLPSEMTVMNDALPRDPAPNITPLAFGWPDGQVCIVRGQGDRLLAAHSGNRGQTFDPDIDVLAGSGRTTVLTRAGFNTAREWLQADSDASGHLYVAAFSPNAAGGLDLIATTSSDAGAHWSAPVVVAEAGTHRPDRFRIAAGPGNRAVITFRNKVPSGVYASVSLDGGTSWGAPVRVDTSGGDVRFVSAAIDSSGGIHVAFTQKSGVNHDLHTANSVDGGATYSAPSALPVGQNAIDAEIDVTAIGYVVVETVTQNRTLWVFRSFDAGVNYFNVFSRSSVGSGNPNVAHAGLAASNTGSVLVIYRATNGRPTAVASLNNGDSFGLPQALSVNSGSLGGLPSTRIGRNAAGRWIVGWVDSVTDGLYAADSSTEGVTWQPAIQIGNTYGTDTTVAGTGSDDFIGGFLHEGDLHVARFPHGTFAFEPDAVVGTHAGTVPHPGGSFYTALTGDGAGHVYAAFNETVIGNGLQVVVRASGDDGRTFGPARELPIGPVGQSWYPALAASSDGYVYATFRDGTVFGDPLYINRSTDFGATWQATNQQLGTDSFYTVSMAAQAGGRAWVAWADADPYDYVSSIRLARTTDGGDTYFHSTLAPANYNFPSAPAVCVTGPRVIVAWTEYDASTFAPTFRVRVSEDSGATFGPTVDLSTTAIDIASPPGLACAPTGHAVAAWPDLNGGSVQVAVVSTFNGSAWSAPVVASAPGAQNVTLPKVAYGDGGDMNIVVAYSAGAQVNGPEFSPRATEIHVARSTNEGASFTAHSRLDASAPDPAAASDVPQIVADGTGRVWIAWVDGSAGVGQDQVAALSVDAGASFGSPMRLSRQLPQGAHPNTLVSDTPVTSYAHAGRAVFLWNGEIETSECAVLNTWNVNDLDGDGYPLAGDCNDQDPDVYPEAPSLCDGKNNDCSDPSWPDLPPGESDPDADSIPGCADNCPSAANSDQVDWDHDGTGDACEALEVTASLPADDDTDVPLQSSVLVTFDHPIAAATATPATLRLENDGTVIPVTVAVDPAGIRATIDPDEELGPNLRYDIIATSGILDAYGNPLTPFSTSFVTAAGPEASVPLPTVSQELEGANPQAVHGSSIASAGDLNGDGLKDVLVGSPGFDAGGTATGIGAVSVYFGRPGQDLPGQPNIRFVGASGNDRAGTSVAGNFDFNSDGVPDILIGAEQRQEGFPTGSGLVYLIFFDPNDRVHYPHLGDGTGITDEVSLSLVGYEGGIPGVVFFTNGFGDRVGFSVAGGGRVNGGAGHDIAIGAPGRSVRGAPGTGTVFVVFDDPSLLGYVDLGRVADGSLTQIFGTRFEGEAGGDELGFSVAFPGDVTAPSGDDLAMGAPLATTVDDDEIFTEAGKVYLASEFRIAIVDAGTIGVTEEGAKFLGHQAGEHVGWSVAGGGDNIVDGYADLLMGAPDYDAPPRSEHPTTSLNRAGRVYQVSEPDPGGVIEVCAIGGEDPDEIPIGGRIWEGEQAEAQLGVAVAGVGDVLGGPYDEIAMGAPYFDAPDPDHPDEPLIDAGRTYVAEGAPPASDDPGGVIEVCAIGETIPGQRYDGLQPGELSGSAVAGLGDVNGSGGNALGVGAPSNDGAAGSDSGTAYVIVPETRVAAGPVAVAGLDQVLECTGVLQATAHLDGSGSYDPGGAIASYLWSEGPVALAYTPVTDVALGLGAHDLTLAVTGAAGGSDTDDVRVEVVDTHGPTGSVFSPAWDECFGPTELPVAITDTFQDDCDPSLSRSYLPGPGPSYADHGDHEVMVTAADRSGNQGAASITFTIDTQAPQVILTISPSGLSLPGVVPLSVILSGNDDDQASGGILYEDLTVAGCRVYDGNTFGDRDGRLIDETIHVDRAELCRIMTTCGFPSLTSPVMTYEASDCGANIGRSSQLLFSGTIRPRDVCAPRSKLGSPTARRTW